MVCHDTSKIKDINVIQPKLILYPPSHPLHPSNQPCHTLYPPNTNVSQQSSDDIVTHTYNKQNNPQLPQPIPPSLPLPNLPSAPHYNPHAKEYDIIEQLKNSPSKISLWDLLQSSPTYNTILQTT